MKQIALVALLVTVILAGCSSMKDEASANPWVSPVDLSRVDRVVTAHPASGTWFEFSAADTANWVKALTDSPATPLSTSEPACHEELELKLYAGTTLVTTAWAGTGDRPIIIDGEEATRQPGPEAKQLIQAAKERMADPYLAQFIPYCEAREAALAANPGAPWRLVFLPDVEGIPTWVATAIGPEGNRDKLFIDARPDAKTRIYRTAALAAETPNLPPKDGKNPLTAQEALALACIPGACSVAEPVDIEFRPAVPLPMADADETFPAWAIAFARTSSHLMDSTGLFEAYTGGLVTVEMPPK